MRSQEEKLQSTKYCHISFSNQGDIGGSKFHQIVSGSSFVICVNTSAEQTDLPRHKHQLHGADTSGCLKTSIPLGVETVKNSSCSVITNTCLIKHTLSWPKSCLNYVKVQAPEFQGSKASCGRCFIVTEIEPATSIFNCLFYSISSACCISIC